MPEDRLDTVEGGPGPGPRDQPAVTPLRIAAALVAIALLAVVVPRSGLLSAGESGREPGEVIPDVGSVVARTGDRLLRLGAGGWEPVADIPDGLDASRLVPVFRPSGRVDLLGVADGTLLSVDPFGDTSWRELAPADQVVGAAGPPGRAVVRRGDTLVEVETARGSGTSPGSDVFPGFSWHHGWRPVTLLPATGVRALLMTRAVGPSQELAYAWPATRVRSGVSPPFTGVGVHDELLGTDADRLITMATDDCSGSGCLILVTTVTRDDVLQRSVEPPEQWRFEGGPTVSGVVVVSAGGRRALARLVPGGRRALLVPGSEDVDPGAGLVAFADGSIRFVAGVGGRRELRGWTPGDRRARRLAGAPPPDAALVCACS